MIYENVWHTRLSTRDSKKLKIAILSELRVSFELRFCRKGQTLEFRDLFPYSFVKVLVGTDKRNPISWFRNYTSTPFFVNIRILYVSLPEDLTILVFARLFTENLSLNSSGLNLRDTGLIDSWCFEWSVFFQLNLLIARLCCAIR